jgi:hypothetical protein
MMTKKERDQHIRNLRADHVKTLIKMREDAARHYQYNDRQIEMRPSERAMTLMHYQQKIDALDWAIVSLDKRGAR